MRFRVERSGQYVNSQSPPTASAPWPYPTTIVDSPFILCRFEFSSTERRNESWGVMQIMGSIASGASGFDGGESQV